ncbi:MAG: DUF4349 domain-containing protein, partial [Myxococcales bacterium]
VRTRLQHLVEQAKEVKDVLAVEAELARVTEQLELHKGRMRALQNQTAYGTVEVAFEERVTPGPVGWLFYGAFRTVKWLFVWD